jgi:hypothetical protein
VRLVLGVVVLYLGFQIWQTLAAPAKIADGFPDRRRVNAVVTLPFPPERFHILFFQGYGRVSGTQDNAVEVRGVNKQDLPAIARPYWVRRVEPLKEGG